MPHTRRGFGRPRARPAYLAMDIRAFFKKPTGSPATPATQVRAERLTRNARCVGLN